MTIYCSAHSATRFIPLLPLFAFISVILMLTDKPFLSILTSRRGNIPWGYSITSCYCVRCRAARRTLPPIYNILPYFQPIILELWQRFGILRASPLFQGLFGSFLHSITKLVYFFSLLYWYYWISSHFIPCNSCLWNPWFFLLLGYYWIISSCFLMVILSLWNPSASPFASTSDIFGFLSPWTRPFGLNCYCVIHFPSNSLS